MGNLNFLLSTSSAVDINQDEQPKQIYILFFT